MACSLEHSGESSKMLIEIVKDVAIAQGGHSRDFNITVDGVTNGRYTKEAVFACMIRHFLVEHPDGEVVVRNTEAQKKIIAAKGEVSDEEESSESDLDEESAKDTNDKSSEESDEEKSSEEP